VNRVERALREFDLAPDRLTLEVTESVMLADETSAIVTLRHLREAGIHVVVDDFGTGYSSLSYLERLPVDGIKIDRSFTEGLNGEPERTAIIRATLSFASALGLAVTAEGVQTAEQLRWLSALRCQFGQGYLFSAPLESTDIAGLVASGWSYPVPERPSSSQVQPVRGEFF
jgi:EAL domain-containing protein (putative c-di-GMP-specific phosphodiesterase class I)